MKDTQMGSLKVRVSVIWLDAVNTYGNSPIKLFSMMKNNTAINRLVVPLKEDGPRRVLNSWWNLKNIMWIIREALLGADQNTGVVAVKKIRALIQFRGRDNKDDDGSKTEKRLLIIFI